MVTLRGIKPESLLVLTSRSLPQQDAEPALEVVDAAFSWAGDAVRQAVYDVEKAALAARMAKMRGGPKPAKGKASKPAEKPKEELETKEVVLESKEVRRLRCEAEETSPIYSCRFKSSNPPQK